MIIRVALLVVAGVLMLVLVTKLALRRAKADITQYADERTKERQERVRIVPPKLGAPGDVVPVAFWDTDHDECPLTVLVNRAGLLSAECKLKDGRKLGLRWSRAPGRPFAWSLNGGSWEEFSRFSWEPDILAWVGRGRGNYEFHIETSP